VTLSRRHLIAGFGTVAIAGSGLIAGLRAAAAQDANVAELHKAGPLGDKILGSGSAPVTIVEYASVTCGACAAFHAQTYPTLKSKYIDTGKVRLIMREFPTAPAPVAIGGFMLARCANEKYFPMIEAIFDQQRSWAQDPYNGLLRIARQAVSLDSRHLGLSGQGPTETPTRLRELYEEKAGRSSESSAHRRCGAFPLPAACNDSARPSSVPRERPVRIGDLEPTLARLARRTHGFTGAFGHPPPRPSKGDADPSRIDTVS
jgi:hypothetical protein